MKAIKIITLSFVILVTLLMNNSCSNSKSTISNMECIECELEPDPGPCKAAFPRFYFDKTEKKCKEFIWGGCNGVVPFETLEACLTCHCT